LNKLTLVAALAALTLAAGISGTQAQENCLALEAQVQAIESISSPTVLEEELAKARAIGPDCPIIGIIMARLVELNRPQPPAIRQVAALFEPY